MSTITTQIIDNIVKWASELQHPTTAKDLTECEEVRVWNDLSGDEGRRRTFGLDGKEFFSDELYEPAEIVQESLINLKGEIDKLPPKQRQALGRALDLSPEYVMNQNFRLKFLRAEQFDARLAAVRMALHFEEKLSLFGEETLGREILLSDLDEDDLDCLKTGYLQVLKELDFGNRKVIFYYKAVSDCYKQRENLLRSFWYIMNTISSSEDVQKLGVVNVVYNLCSFPEKGMDYEKSRRLAKLVKAIPVRFCSFYPCINSRAWAVVVDTFSFLVSKYLRFRFRVIKGDHEWVLLKLKAIGIPSETLPVSGSSELLVDDHLAWIASRAKEEESETEPPCKRSRAQRENRGEAISSLFAPTAPLLEGGFKGSNAMQLKSTFC